MTKHGCDVEVVTAMPMYPQWSIWPAYRNRFQVVEKYEGMTVRRSWHFVRPDLGTRTRLLHELTLCVTASVNVVRALRRADVVYIVSPPLSLAFMTCVLARTLRVRSILCVKDIVPDAAIELGMVHNKYIIGVSRWLARKLYRFADEIHTLGRGMQRRIAREISSAANIRVISDTIDSSELTPVPTGQNEFRRRFVSEGMFAVVHTGNMGKKQDLDLLLRAAARLREQPKIHFYVFGDGAAKQDFLRRREQLGLENVSHYPLQERWLLPHILSGADVLLVSQMQEVVDIVVPSKLLTALGSGAMVVAACAGESEAAAIVADSGGGIVIPAGDDAALAERICSIRDGSVDTRGYRMRAREYALRVFDRDAVYGPLADELKRLAQPRAL
jgi:colanic acid biosynthesis glycosyl transferase WcaI